MFNGVWKVRSTTHRIKTLWKDYAWCLHGQGNTSGVIILNIRQLYLVIKTITKTHRTEAFSYSLVMTNLRFIDCSELL